MILLELCFHVVHSRLAHSKRDGNFFFGFPGPYMIEVDELERDQVIALTRTSFAAGKVKL